MLHRSSLDPVGANDSYVGQDSSQKLSATNKFVTGVSDANNGNVNLPNPLVSSCLHHLLVETFKAQPKGPL